MSNGSPNPPESPREIEYENDVIVMDYLQEKFDEEEIIAKEVDEESHLKKSTQQDDPTKAKVIQEDIAIIKAKIKQKQQQQQSGHVSANENKNNSVSVSNGVVSSRGSSKPKPDNSSPRSIGSKEKFPSVAKIPSEKLTKPSHPAGKEQHQKLPNLIPPKSKIVSQPPKKGKAMQRELSDDDLKSMEILRRREEEIIKAKLKREKLLKEQEELKLEEEELLGDLNRPQYDPPPLDPSRKKRRRKKKTMKEFLVKYDSKSGLFGVDLQAERESKLENYRIQRKMKMNAEMAEIQRARVRLHRNGAYDLYNQGTVSLEGRDLFHERPPRVPVEESERLTSLSERKETDSEVTDTKRSSSAENSPKRQYPFHHDVQLNHVSHRPSGSSDYQKENTPLSGELKEKKKKKIPKKVEETTTGEEIPAQKKAPLDDFPYYLQDSVVEPPTQKPAVKIKKKITKSEISEVKDLPSPSKKDQNALDMFESETPVQVPPSVKPEKKVKTKPKKSEVSKPGDDASDKIQAVNAKNDVMKQLDIEFPDYLQDSPSPITHGKPSPRKPRDLSRPTKASVASQAQHKPKVDEKDIGKKNKNDGKAIKKPRSEAIPSNNVKSKAPKVSGNEKVSSVSGDEAKVEEFPNNKQAVETTKTNGMSPSSTKPKESEDSNSHTPSKNQNSEPSPLVLTPQPPSIEKSHSFTRKNSNGNHGGGNSPTLSISAQKSPIDELVISGTKLPTPMVYPDRDAFSPKSLKFDGKLDSARDEDYADEMYEIEANDYHEDKDMDDVNNFLEMFDDKKQSLKDENLDAHGEFTVDAHEERYDDGDDDYYQDDVDENQTSTHVLQQDDVIGGEDVVAPQNEGEAEETSHYEYSEDSFAPYESYGIESKHAEKSSHSLDPIEQGNGSTVDSNQFKVTNDDAQYYEDDDFTD